MDSRRLNYLVASLFEARAFLKVKARRRRGNLRFDEPRLLGDEFYTHRRELPKLATAYFFTGFAADPKLKEFLDGHDLKHLVKPFPVQDLITCVKELLAEKP